MNVLDQTRPSIKFDSSNFLTTDQVLQKIQFRSRTTLWQWERAGKFPKRVVVGGRSVRWRERDVLSWLESQVGK